MLHPNARCSLRTRIDTVQTERPEPATVEIWGLPLAALTLAETVERIDDLIRLGSTYYVITANMNYAMLSASDHRLQRANRNAAFVVADGMPLVWSSLLRRQRLPERVTGADLLPALCLRAAKKGHRVLLLGGAESVAAHATCRLQSQFPGLRMIGMNAPVLRGLSAQASADLVAKVKSVRPDLLLLACSQPEGELWLAENCPALGVPACVQIGAAIDFAAGTVTRAPRIVQKLGLEWLFRLSREPLRLAPRYWKNACFLISRLHRQPRGKGA